MESTETVDRYGRSLQEAGTVDVGPWAESRRHLCLCRLVVVQVRDPRGTTV